MANEENLKPFKKGDKRINRKGRPKDFSALRELAQEIAHEPIGDGNKTVVQAIMRKWAGSNDARLQMAFVKVAFGEAPATLDVNLKGDINQTLTYTSDELAKARSAAIEKERKLLVDESTTA